jgi:hypothetical protein
VACAYIRYKEQRDRNNAKCSQCSSTQRSESCISLYYTLHRVTAKAAGASSEAKAAPSPQSATSPERRATTHTSSRWTYSPLPHAPCSMSQMSQSQSQSHLPSKSRRASPKQEARSKAQGRPLPASGIRNPETETGKPALMQLLAN